MQPRFNDSVGRRFKNDWHLQWAESIEDSDLPNGIAQASTLTD